MDRAQEAAQNTTLPKLKAAGLEIRTDKNEKLMHNKYCIIDGRLLITGSYNWSDNAELSNAENIIVIHDATTTAAFAADFTKHWNHSYPFVHHEHARKRRPSPRATPPPSPNKPTQKGP